MRKICLFVLIALLVGAVFGADTAAAGGKLRIGIEANYPPYEFYQKQSGAYTGFDVELIEALSRLMGYDGVEFVNTPFNNILKGLGEGKYDAAISAIYITPERQRIADFTMPYAIDGSVVIGKIGSSEKPEYKVSAEKGSVNFELAEMKFAGSGEAVPAESAEEAILMLIDGRSDRAITASLTAKYYLSNGYGDKIEIISDGQNAENTLGIAVRKGNKVLLNKLNAALQRYKNSSAYEMLYRTYFGAID